MPKISAETADTATRAPRKRAPRRVVEKTEASIRRSRTTAASSAIPTATSVAARRAPVRVAAREPRAPSSKKYLVTLGVFLVVFGAAAWIGVSDAGVIDVNSRITERNEKAVNDAASRENQESANPVQAVMIPVQNTAAPSVPNAGLRGRGVGTPDVGSEVPPPVVEEGAVEGEAPAEEETSEETASETPAEPGTSELAQ